MKDIVVFIGGFGRGDATNQIAAVLIDNTLEIARYQVQGLVPTGLYKRAVFLHQGVSQALGALNKVHPETAFDAEVSVVFSIRIFNTPYTNNFVVIGPQFQLATTATMGTGGTDPCQIPGSGLQSGQLFRKSSGWASLQARTAGDAFGESQGIVDPGADRQFRSPVGKTEDIASGNFAARTHAAAAQNTKV